MLTVNSSQYFNPPQFNLRVFVPNEHGSCRLPTRSRFSNGFAPPPTSACSARTHQRLPAALEPRDRARSAVDRVVTLAYAGSKDRI